MANTAAERIAIVVERMLGEPTPLRIRAWDGSEAGPQSGPVLVVSSRRAIRRLLWRPDELGLGRAWVAGEISVDGDLEEALRRMETVARDMGKRRKLSASERPEVYRAAVLLGAVGPRPKPPPQEVELSGDKHTKNRDKAAISHHYNVGNDFYRLVLGPSMTYSCAYWNRPGDPGQTLEDAQRAKHDLICRKLGLGPGMRLLDVGCGWGGLVLHAAREYGVNAVGITLASEQVEYARKEVSLAGLDGQVDIRSQDWRDLDDPPFDAIASVGMAEHLGAQKWAEYASALYGLLVPGGRLLNHQIVRKPGPGRSGRSFIDAYVFPDGELLPAGDVVSAIEDGGFEVRDVENLREHYARTLRAWVSNLESSWERAVELAGPGRARVWRLYMTGSALSFDAARIGITQVLAIRPHPDGTSDVPMTRTDWLGTNT